MDKIQETVKTNIKLAMKFVIQYIMVLLTFLITGLSAQEFEITSSDYLSDTSMIIDQYGRTNYFNSTRYKKYLEINVEFINGVGPYTCTTNGATLRGITGNSTNLYYRQPGFYKIVAQDNEGRSDSCITMVSVPTSILLGFCNRDSIRIQESLKFLNFKDFQVSYILDGSEVISNTLMEIPIIPVSKFPVELIIRTKEDLRIVHRIDVNIDNILAGTPCDDDYHCTTNDRLNEDCICVGKHIIDSFDIRIEYADDCLSNELTASTDIQYPNQGWVTRKSGLKRGNNLKTSINEITEFKTFVIDDSTDCEIVITKMVYPKTKTEIKSNSKTYCNEKNVLLSIEESEDFNRILWSDEFNNLIDSSKTSINVTREGKYKVYLKSDDCYKQGEFHLKSEQRDYKIISSNFQLCDKVELSIYPYIEVDEKTSIVWKRITYQDRLDNNGNWEIIETSKNNIEVSEPGVYSVDVSVNRNNSKDICTSHDESFVFNDDTKKLIGMYLHKIGFLGQKFLVNNSVPKKKYNYDASQFSEECNLDVSDAVEELHLIKPKTKEKFILQNEMRKNLLRDCQWSRCDKKYGVLKEIKCDGTNDIKGFLKEYNFDDSPMICFYYIEEEKGDSYLYLYSVYSIEDIVDAIR